MSDSPRYASMPLFSDLSAADLAHSDEVEYQRELIEEEDAKDRVKEQRNDDEDEDYEQQSSSQSTYYSSSQASQTVVASSQAYGSTSLNQGGAEEDEENDVDGETVVEGDLVREPSVSDSEPDLDGEECDFEAAYPELVQPSSQPQPEDTYRLHSRKVASLDYVEDDDDEEDEEDEEEKDGE
ncbi:hypothetical protein BKA70DRAFT_1418235 [Coprinopsis sp. MPI-PUGE-AT-0042]|nr:hypothetical protein BKA70DRAFT_1418235 [Coprinopsis sp. MPI-PUGE-AT-0042]